MSEKLETEFRGLIYFILGQGLILQQHETMGLILTIFGSIGIISSLFIKDN